MKPTLPEEAPLVDLGRGGLRANRRFAGLVVVLLPVLIGLGVWQLDRAAEKRAALAHAEAQRGAPALPLVRFAAGDDMALDGRRVELRGRYEAGHQFLLDNSVYRGRVGYELITPFRDDSGTLVMVARGWLPAPQTRTQLPRIETPPGQLVLSGEFHVLQDRRRLALHASEGWPRVVQALDVRELGRLAGSEVFPHLVRIGTDQPGGHEAAHARGSMQPERHLAYAVQWFLLAAALVIVFLLGGTNLRGWWRHRRAGGGDTHER